MSTLIIDSPALKMAADSLGDIESLRIASENRLRSLTRSEEDSDGEMRGLGLDENHPDVARAALMVENIKSLEAAQVKTIQQMMRRHPLYGWVKNSIGVGEKQAARLLATIGDPYIAERVIKTKDGKIQDIVTGPRTAREFMSYCGYGIGEDGQARRRKKGEKSNWNVDAKMRAYLIARYRFWLSFIT